MILQLIRFEKIIKDTIHILGCRQLVWEWLQEKGLEEHIFSAGCHHRLFKVNGLKDALFSVHTY